MWTAKEYCQYLQEFVDHHGISHLLRFRKKVVQVSREPDSVRGLARAFLFEGGHPVGAPIAPSSHARVSYTSITLILRVLYPQHDFGAAMGTHTHARRNAASIFISAPPLASVCGEPPRSWRLCCVCAVLLVSVFVAFDRRRTVRGVWRCRT